MKKKIYINDYFDNARIRRIFYILKENKKFRTLFNPVERSIFGNVRLFFWIFKIIREFLSIMFSFFIFIIVDYCIFTDTYYSIFSSIKLKKIKVAKLLRKKIIYDFYISEYDTYVLDRKKYDKNSKKANKLKKYDKYVLKNSDLIIFLNEAEADYYCKVAGVNKYEINYRILPITTTTKPTANLDFFYNKREVLNICWWGTYIPLHGLNKIINAMEILRKNYMFKFKLYIFGNSKQKSISYEKLVNDKNLNDIIMIRNDLTFANEKLEKFLKDKCDLALGPFGKSKKAKTVVSNKVVEACAMKIPILTGYSTGMAEYFDPDSDIYFCNSDIYDIAEKIIYISNNKNDALKRVNNNYLIYKNNFSIASHRKKINNIFNCK